jgi:hypothetical protein
MRGLSIKNGKKLRMEERRAGVYILTKAALPLAFFYNEVNFGT